MNARLLVSSFAFASTILVPAVLRAEVPSFDFGFCLEEAAAQQPNPLPSPSPTPMPMPAPRGSRESRDSRDSHLYDRGTRAINESRWPEAEGIFSSIVQQHGDRADGALYWVAYAQNKEGHQDRALETCAQLRHEYPNSNWLAECDALRIEIRGGSGHPVQPQAEQDEELKLLALNSIMQQDQARAIPILQQILNGNGSDRLKERALFVLAQSNSKEAQDAIGQIARGQSNPALQRAAIQMYAAMHAKDAAPTLADIYQHTSDEAVKKAILQSLLITGCPDKLLEVARTEQNPQLVRTAVRSLGAMGDASDLLTLYKSTSNKDTKASIIDAFIVVGHRKRDAPNASSGADALASIANSEQDPDLRRKAIRNLGIAGGAAVTPALLSAYQGSTDPETKKAAVDALFLSGDAHDLVTLARTEKDPEVKRSIVSKLGIMHNKEATDYMLEILNK